MVTLRQLTGWIALVIASVGPMPLWAHHVCCHTHIGGEGAAHAHLGHAHSSSAHAHHCHHHAHTGHAADLSARPPAGFNATADPHDCAICYHLSQSASVAGVVSVDSALLPPIASLAIQATTSIATLCGWPAPRGPPVI